MAAIPDSTKTSLQQKLRARARERWPQIKDLTVTFRAGMAYVQATTDGGDTLALCRLRYLRSASLWGFAIYLASRDGYQDSVLPSGQPSGSPEEALDCACGLYLNDPTAWA